MLADQVRHNGNDVSRIRSRGSTLCGVDRDANKQRKGKVKGLHIEERDIHESTS